MPESNPLTQKVGPLASRAVSDLSEAYKIHERCGGARHLAPACARLARVDPNLETHVDDNAIPNAADAVAVAVHALERTKQEHSDANRNEIAIDRARVLLVEALLLLECTHAVNYHADAIAKARADAVANANKPPSPPPVLAPPR